MLFSFVLLLNNSQPLLGQNSTNPFEITPRLPKPKAETEVKDNAFIPTGNPFDIVKGKEIVPKKAREKRITNPTPTLKNVEKSASTDEQFRQFSFVTLLVLLVVLTLMFTIFRTIIGASYRAFLNDNILNQLHRDQRDIASIPFQILYLLFFFNAGTFVFIISKHFDITISESNLIALLICIGGVALIFILKHILLKLVSGVFPIKKEIGTYSFTIIIFNIILGIALVPFIIFIPYGNEKMLPYVVNGSFILIAIFYLYRSLRGLFIGNRFLAYHKFHFLLYICTVEIAPLMILLKVLLSQEG